MDRKLVDSNLTYRLVPHGKNLSISKSSGAKSFMKRFGEKLLSFDKFSETFSMKLDDDQAVLPSIIGTFLSILLLFIVTSYAI